MKMVTAIIRPERLDDVVGALEAIGIDKFTVTEVTGIGRTPPPKRVLLQEELPQEELPQETSFPQLPPRRAIEIAVASERVSKVIAAICTAASTNKPGDGKIFVAELEAAVRIRSHESGVKAL